MKKNDHNIEIQFVCPKPLAEALDRLAKANYSSRSAVLRRLLAQAADKGVPA
jgi:metal-responsive CopG/Arc/MetJ family transcriptional regulator